MPKNIPPSGTLAQKKAAVKDVTEQLKGLVIQKLPVNQLADTKRKNNSKGGFYPESPDDNTGKLISQVFRIIENMTRKDVRHWHAATQAARQVQFPNRSMLYDLYTWPLCLDMHAMFLQRKLFMMLASVPYQLVNKKTKAIDEKATTFFKKSWMMDPLNKDCYMNRWVETFFWGFTVMEQIEADPAALTVKYEMVPRKHIVPEYGAFIKYQGTTNYQGYRNTDLADYLIEIGYKYDLGWFDAMAPLLLFKKNAFLFWSEFGESYGMPIAHMKTNSRDPLKKNEMEKWLQKVGSKKYIITDLADTLDLKENNMSDAGEKVYKMMIEAIDEQLTQMVLMQALSSGTGKVGSMALGKVHSNEGEEVKDVVRMGFVNHLNETLLPQQVKQGFPWADLAFEFIGDKKIDPTRLAADQWAFGSFEFDVKEVVEYMSNVYGLNVTGIKPDAVPPMLPQGDELPGEGEEPAPKAPDKKKIAQAKALFKRLSNAEMHLAIQALYKEHSH